MLTLLHGHNSFENAAVAPNYPYGSLRTEARFWVETATKGRGKGEQRAAFRTKNPKTGVWNAPKYGTYSSLVFLFKDENDHIHNTALHITNTRDAFRFVTQGLYFQLNEQERKDFNTFLIACRILNPDCWARNDAILTHARQTPNLTPNDLLMIVQKQRPDDHYLYEADCKEVLDAVKAELAHNSQVNYSGK